MLAGKTRSVSSKLLGVIEIFTASDVALSLSDIARKSDLPLATTLRFVREWVAWGGLIRLDDGRYAVGTRLWEVGVQAPSLQSLRNAALPFLDDLLVGTRQNAQLAILQGFETLYVEKISARNSTVLMSRVGMRLPLHATGVGLVLLANSGQNYIDEYLELPLKKYTACTVVDPRQVRQRLASIRVTGFVRAEEELHSGVISLAAPVHDRSGRTVAAISAVVSVEQRNDRSLDMMVRVAGLGVSRALGFRGSRVAP
ncbi:IclR family transcriptional regulator [Cryobacterium glaciale]|uniref:IclR family transcriptional regulator n=1 Tax=Cryobacterium glaciale TaxID=1259145 RepID=A0A4R8USD6_9MICO|nr:IclR family transcriptional regulator [Cryobacterium glaciale]